MTREVGRGGDRDASERRRRWRRIKWIAVLVGIAAGALAWLQLARPAAPRTPAAAPPDRDAAIRIVAGPPPPPETRAQRRARAYANRPPPTPDQLRASMARMFADVICKYSTQTVCARGRELATACAGGDVTACAAMADLWLRPPVNPAFAKAVSGWACGLGDERGCAYEDRYVGYRQWPDGRPDDPAPAVACAGGDPAACYVIAVRSWDKHAPDVDAARRGCALGVPDLCAMLAGVADRASDAVADMIRACELGSPPHCGFVIEMYDEQRDCCAWAAVKTEDCVRCPPADPERAGYWMDRYQQLTGRPYEPPVRWEDQDE